ncbi:MAG: 6,7-dimethyl-8-ribityllumazine synthase [Balneola sp.]|jgi:6,7-dimethyl-8-ribityllumazine synthase|nr:6,7-dimethyl-8-ribityllumazine synthase [Balneola sp.]
MSINYIEGNTKPSSAKVGIVVSRWNSSITERMLNGAIKALNGNGIPDGDIVVARCPGSFELPLAVKSLLESRDLDGVIALGVVIRGGTPHFEYVCDAVTTGITNLNLSTGKPIAFGVLTTDDTKQALERVADKGNKGAEAALAVLEMISLQQELNK